MVNTFGTGFGSDIEKDDHVGLKQGAECIEKPAMRIQLFRIWNFRAQPSNKEDKIVRIEQLTLLFQTEYHLSWNDTLL